MPDVKFFIDTNVLLYSHDNKNIEKAVTAKLWLRELSKRELAVANLQVLNEFTDVLLRRKWYQTPEQVFAISEEMAELGYDPLTHWEVNEARRLHLRYHYSWWDCLLLASAIELGCTHFLSEDLQDGQVIDTLTIVDPFAHSPEQILISR
ncbi:MAG: PIN domain-containing protein [Mesorhizobium sp.]|nr:PIN domain-containing protein [Mesorhizobium sp.]MBL8576746.1 PIN domain-containing protein [Mesorhizobium sp.]